MIWWGLAGFVAVVVLGAAYAEGVLWWGMPWRALGRNLLALPAVLGLGLVVLAVAAAVAIVCGVVALAIVVRAFRTLGF